MERTPNKSQHKKLTLEEKILLPLLPGFELGTFRSRVRRSTNKLSRFPGSGRRLNEMEKGGNIRNSPRSTKLHVVAANNIVRGQFTMSYGRRQPLLPSPIPVIFEPDAAH